MKTIIGKLSEWANRDRDSAFLSSGASDLPIDEADARQLLDSRDDVRERMLAMAARFGLTAKDIDRDWWTAHDVAIACGHCANEGICRFYLEEGGGRDPEAFCPNHERYSTMAAGKEA